MYPTDEDLYSNITSRYLVRTLTRSTILTCAAFPYLDLLQLQLEKLAVNCIINPTTALLNVPNGSLLGNTALSRVSRLLIAEISAVIQGLPELEGVPNVRSRFSPTRLEALCGNVLRKTAVNSSSMREDIRRGRDTEADYINGYIVRRGEEQGLKCVLNYMMAHLVKGKSWDSANRSTISSPLSPYGVSEMDVSDIDGGRGSADPGEDGAPVWLEDRGTLERGEPGQMESERATWPS